MTYTKLNPIIKDDEEMLWCAPAAICTVSGRSTSEINSICREYKKDNLSNFPCMDIIDILEKLGHKVRVNTCWQRLQKVVKKKRYVHLPVFTAYCSTQKAWTGHIIATNNGYYTDTLSLQPVEFPEDYDDWCWTIEVRK